MSEDVLEKNAESEAVAAQPALMKNERKTIHGEVVAKLVSSLYYVHQDTAVETLSLEWSPMKDVYAVGVVDDLKNLQGIVVRRDLFDTLGKPYGRDVMKHKTVSRVTQMQAALHSDRNIYTVADELKEVMKEPKIHYFPVVNTEGDFYGIFSTRDLLVYLSSITQKDIDLARTLQMSIVKEEHIITEDRFEIVGASKMAKGVGGDFYTIVQSDKDRWMISLCDVSGKGVAASLITTSMGGMFSLYDFKKGVGPFIQRLSAYIFNTFDSQKFVTGVFIDLHANTGEMTIYDMGHSLIYVYRDDMLFRLKTSDENTPMGIMPEMKVSFNKYKLQEGDMFLLVTDGITEQINRAGEEYGDRRIGEILRRMRGEKLKAIKDAVFQEVKRFREPQPQYDDMTMVLLTYLGNKLERKDFDA